MPAAEIEPLSRYWVMDPYHNDWWLDRANGTFSHYVCLKAPPGANFASTAHAPWRGWSIPHSDALPPGCSWEGTYYPALRLSRGLASYQLSDVAFNCPHCAMLEASRLIADDTATPAGTLPTVIYFNDGAWRGVGCPIYTFTNEHQPPRDDLGNIRWHDDTTKDATPADRGCRNCGMPGHNSRTCTRPPKHYDKIGIEIEGGYVDWRSLATANNAAEIGVTSCGDGSISSFNPPAAHGLRNDPQPREFQTRPGILKDALKQLAAFFPDYSNASCGMHVHVSFKDDTYVSQLATPEFYAFFKARWGAWGLAKGLKDNSEFFRRLNGKNTYCQINESHRDPFNDDRYKQINFSSWGEHKTVECRLLPMFKSLKLAMEAVTELICIYEDWFASDANHTYLPEVSLSSSSEWGHSSHSSADIDTTIPEPSQATLELEIAELSPVPEGMRRVALSMSQLETLREMGLDITLAA